MTTQDTAQTSTEQDDLSVFESIARRLEGFLYRCENDEHYTMHFMAGPVARITGYPPSRFLVQQDVSYAGIIHEEDADAVDRAIDEAVASGNNWQIDYRIRREDGDIRWVHENGGAVFGDGGQVRFLEGVVVDITIRKLQELERDELVRHASEATRGVVGDTERTSQLLRQLKMLSINAGIEANRAGPEGAGFTVVAEEAKKISEEGQDLARSISERLKTLSSYIR